jgi:hypothetical protein
MCRSARSVASGAPQKSQGFIAEAFVASEVALHIVANGIVQGEKWFLIT